MLTFLATLPVIAPAAELPNWKEEWSRVIEAAKQEGQLSLYGGQEITHPDIIAGFNKDFPFIKVSSASGRAADIMTRIVAERRADRYLADVTASGPNGPRMLYLNKILDPIAPTFILPEVSDPSRWYGGRHWYADPENKYIFMFEGTIVSTGLSVNTKLVSAEEINSYWDLLQPKWRGKLLGQDPRGVALSTPVLILYHRPGLERSFCVGFTPKPISPSSATAGREPTGLRPGNFPFVIYAATLTRQRNRDCRLKIFHRTN